MSIEIMSKVWNLKNLTSTHKLILLALADQANDQGECWPSITHIAKKCCTSDRTVQRALCEFIEHKLIEKETRLRLNNSQASNLYYLNLDLLGVTSCHPRVTPCHQGGDTMSPPNTEPSYEPSIINNDYIINNKKKKTNKLSTTKNEHIELPNWLPQEDWNDFVQHRKDIKKPLTELSTKRTIIKLEKLKNAGHDIRDIIDQSITNGWQGLFPNNKNNNNGINKNDRYGDNPADRAWNRAYQQAKVARESNAINANSFAISEIQPDLPTQMEKPIL